MNHLNVNRHRLGTSLCGLAVLASAGLLTSGSASAQPSTTSATAKTSTPSLKYAPRGSHGVGYREFSTTGAQDQPLTVRAWYPARRPEGQKRLTINYTAPNKFGEEIFAGKEITSVGSALLNGRPERTAKPYPLVVFSHGFAISPIVFSTLVEHYASRGYIVLAPEHNETFDQSFDAFWKAIVDRPVDIRQTIDYAQTLTGPGEAFAGMIDMNNIAVVGHSYGGYTALAAAGARFDFSAYKTRCAALTADDPLNFFCGPVIPKEPDMATRAGLSSVPTGLWPSLGDSRVKAVISMAGDAYQFDRQGLAEIKIPIMVMGGTIDEGTPYTWGAKLTYDHVSSKNKTLITFAGAGHNLFVDPCDTLPWVQNFSYREPFCTDTVWGKRRPLAIVTHYTTAFLRETLNADPSARASLTRKQPKINTVGYSTSR
jgi:predicted dienelactone hydrolase